MPDLQPLYDFRFFIFYFFNATKFVKLLESISYCWKGIFKTFPLVYYTPPDKRKKQNLQLFSDYIPCKSKLFDIVFYYTK